MTLSITVFVKLLYADLRNSFIVVLNVIMLSVVMLNLVFKKLECLSLNDMLPT